MEGAHRRLRLTSPSLALAASAFSVVLTALIAGVPDSPITAVLPPGARALAVFRLPARILGLTELGRIGKVAFAGATAGFAAAAFALVLRSAWRGEVSLRSVLMLGLAFHVIAVALPVLFAEDVFLYAGFGRVAGIHHANPYLVPAGRYPADPFIAYVPSEWRDFLPYYGPAFLLVARQVTNAIHSLPGVLWAFKLLAGVCSVATMFLVTWLGGRLWPSRRTFAVALLGLNPLVLFHVVGGAHIDAFIALAVVGAWALVTAAEGRDPLARTFLELSATLVIAVAAMMKPPIAVALLVFVPGLVARRGRGERLRPALAHLAVVVLVALAFALPFLQASDPTLGMVTLLRWTSPLGGPTFFRVVIALVSQQLGVRAWGVGLEFLVRAAFALTFLTALAALIRRRVAGGAGASSPIELGAVWGWAWLVLLLTSPQLRGWYLIWVLPFVWVLPRTPRRVLVAMSLALPLFLVIPARTGYLGIAHWVISFQIAIAVPALFVGLVLILRDLADRLGHRLPLHEQDLSTGRADRPAFEAEAPPRDRGRSRATLDGPRGVT